MRAPDCLRQFNDFLIWRAEPARTPGAKPIKVPMHWDGVTRHSTANPAPLLSAEQAEQWLAYLRATGVGHDRAGEAGYIGMGFRPSPSNGIVCIDIDNQLDTPLMSKFNGAGYELSISGTGLHLWGLHRESERVGRRGQVQTPIGKLEVYADGQFIALGTWLAGSATSDCTEQIDQVLAEYFPVATARGEVTAPDWETKTEPQRAAAVADLRAALKHYDPDNRDEWVAAGQSLQCLGDLGRQLWSEWSATSTRFPGGADLEKWETFTGERSDYRAIFARAASRGWVNPARGVLPETVFIPGVIPAAATSTPAGESAVRDAVARLAAVPTVETLTDVAFNVARMGAGGQLDWRAARDVLADAAPWADATVLDRAEVKAKLVPLTASAMNTIEAEQPHVVGQVGWLRDEGLSDPSAVLNERALAFRMFNAHPGELRRMTNSEEWIAWHGGRWVSWMHKQVRDICMHEVPVMLAREMIDLGGVGAVDYMKAATKAATTATAGCVADTLAFLPGVLIKPEEVNADPMLCGMDRGARVLDLRTGVVRQAQFQDHITRSLGPRDVGSPEGAVRWLQFLDEVFVGDKQLIDWMHRFVGYMLTGDQREHVFLFLFGHGSNGKSVFTGVIEQLMGEYGRTLQPASLCEDKRSGGGPSADLASLDGMRLVTSAEAEEGSKFAESLLKGLVAGDKMPVRKLYGSPYDMKPVLKLVLTGNHKPTIKGSDDGIWRRVRLIPFKANFQGREDTQLGRRLGEEMPHILAWAIQGCLQWQQRGLRDVPACVAEATAEYRDEMDVLGQWLTDQCQQGGSTEATILYTDYKVWAEKNGLRVVWTKAVFGKKLTEYSRRGWSIGSDRTMVARMRTGISLINPIFLTAPQ